MHGLVNLIKHLGNTVAKLGHVGYFVIVRDILLGSAERIEGFSNLAQTESGGIPQRGLQPVILGSGGNLEDAAGDISVILSARGSEKMLETVMAACHIRCVIRKGILGTSEASCSYAGVIHAALIAVVAISALDLAGLVHDLGNIKPVGIVDVYLLTVYIINLRFNIIFVVCGNIRRSNAIFFL